MQVQRNHNFNKKYLAPVGCKIIIHNRTNKCPFWSDHGSRVFYVGPVMKQFRNFVCFKSETKAVRVSNTVNLFPTTFADPTMTATDRLSLIMTDLLEVLKAPKIPSPIFNSQRELTTAITTLQSILGRDNTTPTMPPPLPVSTPTTIPITTNTTTRSSHSKPVNLYPISTIICRCSTDTLSFLKGVITPSDATNNLNHVKYLQGDR